VVLVYRIKSGALQISVLYTKLYNFGWLRDIYFIVLVALLVSFSSAAQDSLEVNHLPYKGNSRKWLIGGISAAGYTGSLIMLNEAWYKNYPKSSFHTFNDAREWQQMDKLGHAWSTYNLTRGLTSAWRWAGLSDKKSILLGSGSAFTYVMIIEVLDAHSAKWGWSWGDVGANTFGNALFAVQELGWKQQRILYKYSGHVKDYDELETRSDELFGTTMAERLLKDYNAQTYWLSVNPKAFLPESGLPDWLNIAVGYGASGMFGGFENRALDKNGNITFDRTDIPRYRQWYLSPDIDFSRIKTNSRAVRTAFTILNMLKLPTPALELSKGKLKVHALYF
jgi:hypothetical protein